MKPCIMSSVFLAEPGKTVRDMFELAQEIEIEGIDFCDICNLSVSSREIKKMCDSYGIKAVCNTVLNDINAPGMTELKWLDNIKTAIEDAVMMQTGKVMIPTPGKPGVAKELTRQKWLEMLAKAVDIAAISGIEICIESYAADAMWSPFISSDDLLLAVNNVPGLKLTFDNGNHFAVEKPVEAFKKIHASVTHVHFKDWGISLPSEQNSYLLQEGKYYHMTLLGEGLVNHVSCIKCMKEYGYRGYINIEYFGPSSKEKAIRNGAEYLRQSI